MSDECPPIDRTYNDIDGYRDKLTGKTVISVDFSDGDEGLVLTFKDGTILSFAFSACEGTIKINN